MRDQLPAKRGLLELSVVDERRLASAEVPLEARVEKREEDEDKVDRDQDDRADQATDQRVVRTDDRVLDDVREQR